MIGELATQETHDAIDGAPTPSANAFLAGHEDIRAFLARAYRTGKMHHALLFEGPRGVGKATLAFHLAGHMLSHADSAQAPADIASPDFGKPLFRQIAGGTHPAILHVDRPLDQKSGKFKTGITVEEIRRVTHFLTRTSHDGAWRIVIVDPADDMNRNAANALLKTLEEPPARALFILISHSAGRLLPTIRSRCQTLQFKPLERAAMQRALAAIGPGIGFDTSDGEGAAALIERSEGSVRKAALLIAHGGLEIAQTTDAILETAHFDLPKAQALAAAIGGREAEIQYDLFFDHVLQRIADRARRHAGEGAVVLANAWSAFWDRVRREAIETQAFNLDKKQAVLILLEKTQRAFQNGIR
ncbi:DNA polymerase III subunit delta' [Paramesorhizobium deserti]|uniref:DNA polymerase III subunit delta n=1 Tax=Paramesorhizobium deserti TaxID=1494590 RepID=A0A135HVT6_9HYPH|nr:DNA polymerase III subunit delta' [Paramesorhizobium deserti]KXF77315.1 DNA polymerase III subunit delta' [Paramesorhizobium deserti]